MSRIAYVNGRYLPQRDASVNVEDRGYQFADGIYEVVHLYRGRFVDSERHLARLERSLNEVRIAMPMTRPALVHILNEVARRNRVQDGLLYMQVTRGVAPRDHAFPARQIAPALVVTVLVSAGLIVAEIELPSEDAVFEKPDWIGQEVTGEKRYYNSSLIKAPYSTWTDTPT